MPTLYSYCIPVDDGAAPNSYFGRCTLNICKPKIRSDAVKGDWVVGTGSKNSPLGDIRDCVVFAMRVDEVLTMKEYDAYCRKSLPGKIPDRKHPDLERRMGDSIYDFSTNPPTVRASVHTIENREHDLGGLHTLISEHFFYFGDKPVRLPQHLLKIIKQGQAHRSASNDIYFDDFVKWIEGLGHQPCSLFGEPQIQFELSGSPGCSSCRDEEE